jgi:hypothetical protein
MITSERMNEQFEKLHLQVGKFPITLHHFTGPDVGDPHDHPLPFWTTILRGPYIEEMWDKDLGFLTLATRFPGQSYYVPARTIHRIVSLPEGECVTCVKWHDSEPRREPRFWRLINGVMRSRQWNEPDFPSTPITEE